MAWDIIMVNGGELIAVPPLPSVAEMLTSRWDGISPAYVFHVQSPKLMLPPKVTGRLAITVLSLVRFTSTVLALVFATMVMLTRLISASSDTEVL